VPGEPNVFWMRIALLDHEPEIWRRLLVPGSVRLDKLHLIFQTAMGWTNSHLHQFRMSNALYGMHVEEWDDDELHEIEYTLAEVVRPGGEFLYDYDFGDSWKHQVVVEHASRTRPVLKFAVCTEGARACPPEDVGGTGGYAQLLEALRDPRHEEHEEYRTWVGEDFDPGLFDLAQVNAALQRIR
ncbi:MAG: plasmid pRiA4b ORF-3 family protein, partial [Acidimicrobiales bacterium]